MKVKIGLMAAAVAVANPVLAQDEYQWLEAPTEARALDWARQQTRQAQAKIAALPGHAEIRDELNSALAAGDPAPDFMLTGPYMLRLQRSVGHPHGVLAVSRRAKGGAYGPWREVLDIDALNKAEGKSYELHFGGGQLSCAPADYSRCMVALSPSGGDEVELREFDLASGAFVQGGFHVPVSRAMAQWLDADHLMVSHTANGAPALSTGWARTVALWTRGTPLSTAKIVYTAEQSDALLFLTTAGEGADRVAVIMRALDYSTLQYLTVGRDGKVTPLPFPTKLKMGYPVAGGSRIFVQLGQDATIQGKTVPAESILAYDVDPAVPADRRLTVAYSPSGDEYVTDSFTGLAATKSGLTLLFAQHGIQRIADVRPGAKGWTIKRAAPEPVGGAIQLSAANAGSDEIIVKRTGYLFPSRLDLVSGGKTTTLFSEEPAFDASRFAVDLKKATSKDGTEIDYYLLRPKSTTGKPTPLLMTGYGAFGISFAPGYLDALVGGKSLLTWLNRGGALAVPLIRGGGERGEAWHQAAIREKRENSYDDFAAVTEALIASGFTTPQHIGLFGMSNGGLLAAVMGTRHPELYGAIVSDVPLTDLVRMPYMGMGAAWTNEYGDVKDPTMLAAINRYSPYQNVVAGRKYPPFLITVATSDNRVGPGHARKLAAKMESVGATVYYLEDEEGGHAVSDPLSRPDLMANRMTFLIDTLMKKDD